MLFGKNDFPLNSFSVIPTAIFGLPEAGSCGLSEEEAIQMYPPENGVDRIKTKTLKFIPMLNALMPADSGYKEPIFMKLVLEGPEENVVGFHLVMEGAAEVMQTFGIAMEKGITKRDLDLTMALHPCIMEELVTLY